MPKDVGQAIQQKQFTPMRFSDLIVREQVYHGYIQNVSFDLLNLEPILFKLTPMRKKTGQVVGMTSYTNFILVFGKRNKPVIARSVLYDVAICEYLADCHIPINNIGIRNDIKVNPKTNLELVY